MSEQVKIGLVLQAYVRCVYASFFYDFFKEFWKFYESLGIIELT